MVKPDTALSQLTVLVLAECENVKFLDRHCSTLQLQYQPGRVAVRYKSLSEMNQLSHD
jgi:hypothetical protein